MLRLSQVQKTPKPTPASFIVRVIKCIRTHWKVQLASRPHTTLHQLNTLFPFLSSSRGYTWIFSHSLNYKGARSLLSLHGIFQPQCKAQGQPLWYTWQTPCMCLAVSPGGGQGACRAPPEWKGLKGTLSPGAVICTQENEGQRRASEDVAALT